MRRQTRRRRPPAWALQVVASWNRARHALGTSLPAAVVARRTELQTAGLSIVVHLLLGFLLTYWIMPFRSNDDVWVLASGIEADARMLPATELVEIVQPLSLNSQSVDSTLQQMLSELDKGPHTNQLDANDINDIRLPLDDLSDVLDIPFAKGDFSGRSDAGKRAAIAKFGGTAESERAVNSGLQWLKSIQRQDGAWSFAAVGEAGQPGLLTQTEVGATSLALLCFLGSGHTHTVPGEYQDTVSRGLKYVIDHAELTHSGADLRGSAQGNSGMYVQGIATLCVSEAAAMNPDDRQLAALTAAAVKFIERAQHKTGGGWRYRPGEAGDTSVVGWQLMALKSAKAGGTRVSVDTLKDARQFLNSVDSDGGAFYSYVPREPARNSMTAVGLLCRMYLGWKREHEGLKKGVQHLATVGPSRTDLYFNYYATQVLRHYGGNEWSTWNLKMREQLVETQVKDGPGAGSWDVTDPHGYAGGRIYQTALSVLTLEVYYRHLPLYREFEPEPDEPE